MSRLDNSMIMDEPSKRDLLERGRQGILGKPLDRIEGVAKVTGAAHYAYEQHAEDMAYGYMLAAEIGRGRITSVDTDAARAAPGVLTVITDPAVVPTDGAGGFDPPGLPRQLPEILNYGQVVGMVVAESFEAARAAAHLVRIGYESQPGRFDMEAHVAEADPNPTTRLAPNQDKGDLDAVMAEAPVTFDVTYTTPTHFAAAMEPHATAASMEGDGFFVHSGQQFMRAAQGHIAATLDVDVSKVRVLSPYVGGGFGTKTGVGPEAVLAAIAARQTGRPVKVALTRRQVAHMVHRRSQTRQRIRIACTAEGDILGIGHENFVSQKPTRNFVEPVAFGSYSLYAGEARRFSGALVPVDLPASSPVRAPGEAVGSLALEVAMDEMAEKLGLDPIEFRKRNEPARDPLRGVPFTTRRLVDCYDDGARRFGWERRNPKPGQTRDGEWLIGVGMAAAVRKNLLVDATARVTLTRDGRALVETDMTDIGTGSYTIAAQVAGELLGLPVDRIEVRLADTDLPRGAGSGGSFGAAGTGASIALACEDIIAELARRMESRPDELTLQDGMATARNRRVTLTELLGGADIAALGTIRQGKNGLAFSQASYGAQFAEVAVSAVTGETRVRRMLGVFDCGRILNRKTARSQAVGGMIWGLGYALFEEGVLDTRTGAFVTRDLAEYHVPVNADVPQIKAYFIEEPDTNANPVGAKGIGELGISGSGAAIANAIYNACGVRVRDYPMTLDRILAGLPDDVIS
jgi:xanthine dehydrogenase YagR molybdenum-binding subunit